MKKDLYIRNKKGQFASLKNLYKEPQKEVFAVPVGTSISSVIESGRNKLIEAARLGISVSDFEDTYRIEGNKIWDKRYEEIDDFAYNADPPPKSIYNENPEWKTYKTKTTEHGEKQSSSNEENFEFNYAVQQRYKLSKGEQENIYQLFKDANVVLKEVKGQTLGWVDSEFSYNLAVRPDVLSRRIDKAKEIISKGSDGFLSALVNKYREDFLDNFRRVISENEKVEDTETSLMEKLEKSINEISPMQFFQLLKFTEKTNLAYSLDSIMTDFNYEQIINEVNFIIKRIDKGDFYN